MAQIYVAKSGNDNSGNGSSLSPYLTIGRAITASTSGDEIVVRPGTYTNENNSTSANPGIAPKTGTTIRAETKPTLNGTTWSAAHTVIINQPATQFGFFIANKFDITLDGLEIANAMGIGINIGGNDNGGHTIKNCIIRDCGSNGISTVTTDLITIDGNEIHHCAKDGPQSGISLLRSVVQPGNALAGGYRSRITNNYCHHQRADGGQTSDGNGIILDKLHYSGYNETYGASLTLISGNYCIKNRGTGIRIMASKNCVVEYNTCYGNGQQGVRNSTWGGEVQGQWARENTYRYNIGFATEGDSATHDQGGFANNGSNNPDYGLTTPGTGNVITGNIFHATAPGIVQNVTAGYQLAVAPANSLGVDPLFVNAEGNNFQTQSGSPARGAALGGKDIGAWQSGSTPPDPNIEIVNAPILTLSTPHSGGTFSLALGTYSVTPASRTHQAQLYYNNIWNDVTVSFAGTNPLTGTIPAVTATGGFRIVENFTGTGVTAGKNPSNWIDVSPPVSTDTLPANTVLPVISGSPAQGNTLSTSVGNWTGSPAPTFAIAWLRNDVVVAGKITSTYLLAAGDVGTVIKSRITASNSVGSVVATSAGTATITGTTTPDDLAGLTIRVTDLEAKDITLQTNINALSVQLNALDLRLSGQITDLTERVSTLELDTSGHTPRLQAIELQANSFDVTIADIILELDILTTSVIPPMQEAILDLDGRVTALEASMPAPEGEVGSEYDRVRQTLTLRQRAASSFTPNTPKSLALSRKAPIPSNSLYGRPRMNKPGLPDELTELRSRIAQLEATVKRPTSGTGEDAI